MIQIWADVKNTAKKKKRNTWGGTTFSPSQTCNNWLHCHPKWKTSSSNSSSKRHTRTHTQRVFHFAITQAVDQLQPAVYSPHFLVWHSSCTSTHPACCPSCLSLLVLRCHSERFHHNRYRSQTYMRSHRFQKCYCHTEAGRLVQVKDDSAYSHKPNLLYLSP